MANQVSTTFVGNPLPLFQVADAVELRLLNLQKMFVATSTLTNPRPVSNLLSAETNALRNYQAGRVKAEEAYTSAYLGGLKLRQEAELASIAVVAEARTAARVATSGSTAVSEAGAASAVGGAGLAGGLIAGASVAAVASVGLILSKSVTVSEEARKKLFELKTGTEALDKQIDDLGKTGEHALERYAESLGRSAESLTETEKRTVLVNTALEVQARNLGNATSKLSDYDRTTAQLEKTSKSLLVTLGGFVTPALTNSLSFVNELLGGAPVASNATRDAEEFNAWKTQQDTILATFKKNKAEFEEAVKNPMSNLLNFSLARFANSKDLLADPATAEKARTNALEMGKQWVDSYIKGIRSQMKLSSIPDLRDLAKQVTSTGNLLPFDQYKSLLDDINKAIADSVDAGKKKVQELGVTYKSVFSELTIGSNADNPFVRIYGDGEKAVKSFREQTVGLNDELRKQGEAMIATQTALKLFGAGVDTAFSAFDLREKANEFRSAVDGGKSADALIDKAIARYSKEAASGLFRNVNNLNAYAPGASQAGRLRLFDSVRASNEAQGLYRNPAELDYQRKQLAKAEEENSLQGKLDRELKLANTFKPGNDAQRALLDNKIISLSQNINPADLRQDQRNNLAAIFERQAERTERRAQEAIDIQKKTLEVNQSIDANQKKLLGIAEKQGIQGIDRILVENGTDSQISVKEATRSPSPSDTSRYYSGELGFAGGSNK